jgi:hypothetical protein
MAGLVRVLFVSVSAKARVARLLVVVGSVTVAAPETKLTATLPVRVLFVRAWVDDADTRIPSAFSGGSSTLRAAVYVVATFGFNVIV